MGRVGRKREYWVEKKIHLSRLIKATSRREALAIAQDLGDIDAKTEVKDWFIKDVWDIRSSDD